MKIVLVAAIGDNSVIGRDGQLPWRLKSDLQHFRKVTLNRPVIMGRKTHESIGKLLPGRTNIVLTRDLSLVAPGACIGHKPRCCARLCPHRCSQAWGR